MKRTILIVMAIVCTLTTGLPANAQTKREARDTRFKENFPFKYEVSLGWAGYPMVDAYTWGSFGCYACQEYHDLLQSSDLDHMYRTVVGSKYMTGIIAAEFSFHYKRWLTFSVEAGVNGIWGRRNDKFDGAVVEKMHGAVVNCLPNVQFNWFNRKNIRLYSGAGLGVAFGAYDGYAEVYPSAQLTPIGITAGSKVFGFAESSIGTVYVGGKFGVGYRF